MEGKVEGPRGQPLDVEALAVQLKVLANAKRLRLLRYLARPHYLEEIASELRTARQTAQEHVQKLEEVGLVHRVSGRRDHGPVTEYVVVPQRLFAVHEELGRAASIEPELDQRVESRAFTMPLDGARAEGSEVRQRRLTIVHGLRIGATTPLVGAGPWLIGRDPAAHIQLDYDPYASGRHAEIRADGDRLVLADLYSSNGTALDWRPLERGGTEVLENGSLVRVGRTLLLLRT